MSDRDPIAMGHSYAEAYGYLIESIKNAMELKNVHAMRARLLAKLDTADWIVKGKPGTVHGLQRARQHPRQRLSSLSWGWPREHAAHPRTLWAHHSRHPDHRTAPRAQEDSEVTSHSGCLLWNGACDSNGYGRVGKKSVRAHRIAWEEAHGHTIPAGMVVMHTCDNPPCINPDHLVLGTVAQNNADRAAKGRSRGTFRADDPKHPAKLRRGERHWRAKLTGDDVRQIRLRHDAGERQTSLAAEFGVNSATISRIVRGVWRQEVA